MDTDAAPAPFFLLSVARPTGKSRRQWRAAFAALYSCRVLLRKGLSALPPATKPIRRWRTGFAAVYSLRALASPPGKGVAGTFRRSANHVALDVDVGGGGGSSGEADLEGKLLLVDAKRLTEVVKGKSHDGLRELGGIAGVASSLGADWENGVKGDDAGLQLRRRLFGSNVYERPPARGFLSFAWEALRDTMLLILLACAALSLGFGIKEHGLREGWYDGASIFLAVFLVVLVSAGSNFRQARRFFKLSEECGGNIRVSVVRDGRRREVSISDVVVGDVVCLNIGDQVPADGLFLDGHSLQVDESSMTGESDHVAVDGRQRPFLTSGTKVADGYGRMLATAVGMDTTWGEMMSSVSRDAGEPTPLQERLQRLTATIGKVGTAVAAFVLAVLLARYFTGSTSAGEGRRPRFDRRSATFDTVTNALVSIVSDAVTIVVVAIPEGLPLAVTLTLAYSMKRMMADKAMVRKLPACETMGAVTAVCTDKTGTLTLNQMQVTKVWIGQQEMGGDLTGIDHDLLELLRQGVALNTTGSVFRAAGAAAEPEFSGSPTEKAILAWATRELRMDDAALRRHWEILAVEAFNSDKKRSGAVVRSRKDGKTTSVHWKGAAEMILAACSYYYDADGIQSELDAGRRAQMVKIIEGMAAASLRCIALAVKPLEFDDIGEDEDNGGGGSRKLEEDGLILLGLLGLKDPCRPGARQAVAACREAGVAVKMITGDNIFTAKAIAFECGILQEEDEGLEGAVIDGETFRGYSPEKRMAVIDGVRVMARSSPFDKLLMVQCLKRKKHVVAVTGDGTNDAPALKEADVGLAMGVQGTEVAKQSADIVILDDNFASVTTVLMWGRCVYSNIQKFIQFQLTVNVAALVINFVAAVSSGEVPLTTVQLLWVNLIMDTLGALALATERPTRELASKPPVGRTAPLITNIMWRNLLAQALFQIAVLLLLHFRGESIFGVGDKVKNTLIFNTFVLCQIFNEFNARRLEKKNVFEGILKNRLFLGIVAFTLVLQVVMVEFMKRFAGTQRLDWGQWAFCIGIGLLSWPIAWAVKCIPVSERPISELLKHQIMKIMHRT